MRSISFIKLSFLISLLVFAGYSAAAQTSEFTYQGKLTDMSAAANGQYDFTFRLFDALTGGTQIGGLFTACNGVLTNGADAVCDNVPVAGGIFTVRLDWGAPYFADGAPRFLEILVRTGASTGAYTQLTPRQEITSSPFSIKSANATSADALSGACVLCVTDAQIASVDAGKISGVLPITNGGTGSSTQNFVDLSTSQIILGNKTFNQTANFSGANIVTLTSSGSATFNGTAAFNNLFPVTVSGELNVGGVVRADQFYGSADGLTNVSTTSLVGIVPIANGGTGSSTQNFVDLSTNQSAIGGNKTFTGVVSGNGSGLTNLNGSNVTNGTISENRLGLAGMGFSGRINGLSPSQGFRFGGANGFTNSSSSQVGVQTLSPHRTCTAMNLSVMLLDSFGVTPVPPGSDNSRFIELLSANNPTSVACTISGSATSCNSGALTDAIGAGSQLSIRITTTDGGTLNDVGGDAILFGWECR